MHVFLLTFLREQMHLTVLEAMGVGLPMIATRVGELAYIIDDGTDTFIRDVTDPVGAVRATFSLPSFFIRTQAIG
jgi:glycosyltransferase involved in cell wall biosynthesis